MSTVRKITALLAIALMAGLVMAAQPGRAQGVLESCEKEIDTYCAKVTPGNGRLIACMYAHENHLSEQCAMAIVDMGDMLDFVFATVREALTICAGDIEASCADTKFGGGRILTCLRDNSTNVTAECKAVVDTFAEELASE